MFIESKILENSAAFTLSLTKWGNRRQADKEKIQTDSDKKMLKLTKSLVESEEYDAICSFQGELRKWVTDRCVPSFFKKGIYLFGLNMVTIVDAYLTGKIEEQKALVEKFLAVYPERVENARMRLNGQFNQRDYPLVEDLRDMFTISWNWMKFGIPENLPQQIFEAEKEKAEKMWAEATEQITLCLRESFLQLISRAAERLRVVPGEKPKVFRDSLVGNIQEFIATFNARNLTNDTELKELVDRAREILTGGTTAETLRDNAALRNNIAAKFGEIEKTLDTMITEIPSRKFAFDE